MEEGKRPKGNAGDCNGSGSVSGPASPPGGVAAAAGAAWPSARGGSEEKI